jgi:hypothetical protein
MGTSSVAPDRRPDRIARRSIDITDMRTRRVREYARRQRDAGELHLERRGGRTYLVAANPSPRR